MKTSLGLIMLVVLALGSGGCAVKGSKRGAPQSKPVVNVDLHYLHSRINGLSEALSASERKALLQPEQSSLKASRFVVAPLTRLDLARAWSGEMVQQQQDNQLELVNLLRSSGQVEDVQLLPSMLLPQEVSLAYLQELASRYSARYLIGYQFECQRFHKNRMFSRDEIRHVCRVDSLLLRSDNGAIVYANTAVQELNSEINGKDVKAQEAMIAITRKAVMLAMRSEFTAMLRTLEH